MLAKGKCIASQGGVYFLACLNSNDARYHRRRRRRIRSLFPPMRIMRRKVRTTSRLSHLPEGQNDGGDCLHLQHLRAARKRGRAPCSCYIAVGSRLRRCWLEASTIKTNLMGAAASFISISSVNVQGDESSDDNNNNQNEISKHPAFVWFCVGFKQISVANNMYATSCLYVWFPLLGTRRCRSGDFCRSSAGTMALPSCN